MNSFAETIGAWLGERTPTERDVYDAFGRILAGEWTTAQVAAFAVALRARGETAEVIGAAARALRASMVGLPHGLERVVDTCGTGGDGLHTLNISTAAAIVVAGCGETVAKHGNRSISSRSGSADVIEAMGIAIDVSPETQRRCLEEAGIAFLFAPAHHPALRHAAQARRELGIRTIFNALGPLVNPATATHQLVGVYEDRLRPIVAAALGALGSHSVWVVRGEDGLDEVSPVTHTFVSAWTRAEGLREFQVAPEDFGLPRLTPEAIRGGDAAQNAAAIEQILGGGDHPARDAVILNAAACLHIATGAAFKDAAELARHAVASGRARQTLLAWRAIAGTRA